MAEVYESELMTQEIEAMHFEFSPRGFSDQVYNCVLDAWSDVVENKLINKFVVEEAKKERELKASLVDMLFFPSFMEIFRDFTNYALRHVFRIPQSVTLPVYKHIHELSVQLLNGEGFDMDRIESKAKHIERHIINKKRAIADLDAQIQEADEGIEELQLYVENLRELKMMKQRKME